MKKIVGFGFAVAAFVLGTQAAQAAPILKMRLTQASATAADCTGAGVWLGGGSCEYTTGGGVINFLGAFGSYFLNQELAVGAPAQPAPALWLNSTNATGAPGSIQISLVAQNYDTPLGMFNLLATASGTVNAGMQYTLHGYFDAANSGIAGAGSLVLASAGTGFVSVADNTSSFVNNSSLYTASWVLNVTRTAPIDGMFYTSGINSTFTQAAPAPGALALIGLGLLGLGAVRRRVK